MPGNVTPLTSPKSAKASFRKRAIAFLIDILFYIVVSEIVVLAFDMYSPWDEWFRLALFYSYNILMETFFQATIGKSVLNIKVIKTNGGKPDIVTAFYRNVGKTISALPYGYGYFRILAPHYHQTIHDELGRSIVVEA